MGKKSHKVNPSHHHQASPTNLPKPPLGVSLLTARTSGNKPPKEYLPHDIYEKVLALSRNKENPLIPALSKYIFNPNDWKYYYWEYKWKEISNTRRALRKMVQIGTLMALLRGRYYIEKPLEEKEEEKVVNSEEKNENDEEILQLEEDETSKEEVSNITNLQPSLTTTTDEIKTSGSSSPPKEELTIKPKKHAKKKLTKKQKELLKEEEEEINIYPHFVNEENNGQTNEDEVVNAKFKVGHEIPLKTVHFDLNALKKMVKLTVKIDCSDLIPKDILSKQHNIVHPYVQHQTTKVQVVEGDCLEAAIFAKKLLKLNPLLLINGSSTNPGGKYFNASDSQEEDICRRSALALCLDDPYRFDENRNWSYPLPEFGGVYVPQCLVIRSPKEEGYAFKEKPTNISMFSLAAYMNPPVEKRKVCDVSTSLEDYKNDEEIYEYFLSGKIANSMKKKIISFFEVALLKGHDCLIISSIGCGAYANPTYHIACLFREVLTLARYRDKFKLILFSIINDRNAVNNISQLYSQENKEDSNDEEEENESEEEKEILSIPKPTTPTRSNLSIFAKVFHGVDQVPTVHQFFTTENIL
ncbi:hypothetical protein ABK040_006664 [Willaertia magna]